MSGICEIYHVYITMTKEKKNLHASIILGQKEVGSKLSQPCAMNLQSHWTKSATTHGCCGRSKW